LTIVIPDTGFAYVNQHMDYGLKGLDTDFDGDETADPQHYVKDANDDAMLPPDPLTDPATEVLIPELSDHVFCTFEGGSELGCDAVQNDNVFKTNPGVAGLVLEVFWNSTDEVTYEEPIADATVELFDKKGNLVGSDISDEDGWYQIVYKHQGRPENYTFVATSPVLGTFERVVKLQGNEFEEVNIYKDSTSGGVGDRVHIEGVTSKSKVGPKTWNATVEMMIVDQGGNAVPNAQVSGAWDTGDTALCVSDEAGLCTVSLVKLDKTIMSVTLTVLDVAADGYLYDPDADDPAGPYTVSQ
jgi:hypothetical protein